MNLNKLTRLIQVFFMEKSKLDETRLTNFFVTVQVKYIWRRVRGESEQNFTLIKNRRTTSFFSL